MAEISNPTSHLEANALFERVMASEAFRAYGSENETCRGILDFLFQQWRKDRQRRFGQTDLAVALGMNLNDAYGDASKNTVRLAVNKLRYEILPAFERENPNEAFTLRVPKDDHRPPYRVEFVPNASPTAAVEKIQGVSVQLILGNRHKTRAWFRGAICDSPDVLYASVGSQHTLDTIAPWFERGEVSAKHFRVLTWWPESEEICRSLTDHLDENVSRFMQKQEHAWKSWKGFEDLHECLEIYRYMSIPTMQAICDADRSIKVELFPFNRSAKVGGHGYGSPEDRPALIIDADECPVEFWFFKHAFEDLWNAAAENAIEADVHPRWRAAWDLRQDRKSRFTPE